MATLRIAEREHPMVFRLQSAGSTAIVEPGNHVQNPLFDALFGTRRTPDDPIEEEFDLGHLVGTIPPREPEIRNDLRPEEEECFTIHIVQVNVPGRLELFSCNEDDSSSTSFFCETTICIEDNDGRYVQFVKIINITVLLY